MSLNNINYDYRGGNPESWTNIACNSVNTKTVLTNSLNTARLDATVLNATTIETDTLISGSTILSDIVSSRLDLYNNVSQDSANQYLTIRSGNNVSDVDDAYISSYQSSSDGSYNIETNSIVFHNNNNADGMSIDKGPALGTLELVSNFDSANPNNIKTVCSRCITLCGPEEIRSSDMVSIVREMSLFSVRNYQYIINSSNYLSNTVANNYQIILRIMSINRTIFGSLMSTNAQNVVSNIANSVIRVGIDNEIINGLFQTSYSYNALLAVNNGSAVAQEPLLIEFSRSNVDPYVYMYIRSNGGSNSIPAGYMVLRSMSQLGFTMGCDTLQNLS